MIEILLGILAMMAAGLVVVFYAAERAPVGYEDASGFHYGPLGGREMVRARTEPHPQGHPAHVVS
jgi:hypothetical protein